MKIDPDGLSMHSTLLVDVAAAQVRGDARVARDAAAVLLAAAGVAATAPVELVPLPSLSLRRRDRKRQYGK